VLAPIRLPFLLLTPACFAVGVATAVWSGYDLNLGHVALALVGALASHVAVNALNEYFDFKSGLDFKTAPTPFSGGSGVLSPDKERSALWIGVLAVGVVAAVGAFFLVVRGPWLLPLGVLGLVVVVGYTRWITADPYLCLIAPGLGFGPLMVMGTHFALTGHYSWPSLVASLVPFFLVSDLLLLNQFPDVEADRSVGRNHIPIRFGRKTGAVVYSVFLAGAYLAILAGYLLEALPLFGLLGLGSIIIAVPTVRGVMRHYDDIPALVPFMGRNVMINLLTPVLLAVGLFFGR
jgi:1,4-dihydroxy-2-naphthoate octaprenyltransferase